jgi:membrane protein
VWFPNLSPSAQLVKEALGAADQRAFFLFAAIYKILPDVRLQWSDVAVGACVTSLLFTIGKQLIGLYLGKTSFGSSYGAAGSLVIVLVWVYYSAQLFFLGAEFTKVYTKTFGSQFARQFERVPSKPDNVIIDPSTNEPTTGTNGEIKVNRRRDIGT